MAVNKLNLFEYRGWSIRMDVRSVGALFAASAELRFDGQCKQRLVLATSYAERVEARLDLESKTHNFIDDWFSRRTHTDARARAVLEVQFSASTLRGAR